jgi:hypothetical protein
MVKSFVGEELDIFSAKLHYDAFDPISVDVQR